jgi:hypothetical protein
MRAHKADNNEMALIALKSLGITSVGYNAQGASYSLKRKRNQDRLAHLALGSNPPALADGNSKQIMGVIWLLMQKLRCRSLPSPPLRLTSTHTALRKAG